MELVSASLPHLYFAVPEWPGHHYAFQIDKSKNSSHYTIITLQSEEVFYRYFIVDSSYTFSKNLQFDSGRPVSWNISITAKKKIHIYWLQPWLISAMATNNDKKQTRFALSDASSVMPEIEPFIKSCWFHFSFPKSGGSRFVMTARDLMH